MLRVGCRWSSQPAVLMSRFRRVPNYPQCLTLYSIVESMKASVIDDYVFI